MRLGSSRLKSYAGVAAVVAISLFLSAGARAEAGQEGTFYSVKVTIEKSKNGKVATIKTVGKSGYHCNTLYPWKLTVLAGSEEEKSFKKKDAKKFSKDSVIFSVPHPTGQKVKAKLKLSVCNDKQCIIETVSLSW